MDRKIEEMLNSPTGAAHYGGRKRRKRTSVPHQTRAAPKRTPRKGSWGEAFRLHRRLVSRLGK